MTENVFEAALLQVDTANRSTLGEAGQVIEVVVTVVGLYLVRVIGQTLQR